MTSHPILILSTAYSIDGNGSLLPTNQMRQRLQDINANVQEYKISSIKDGWETTLPENVMRGACAPISVIMKTKEALESGEVDAVIISGKDFIRSDFKNKKEERDRLMKVYEGKYSFLEAYQQLTHHFLKYWNIQPEDFRLYSEALFKNHFEVWKGLHPDALSPDKKWFEPVNDLFRGVDCANPNVDFEGCLILGTSEIAKRCGIEPKGCVQIAGIGFEQVGNDSISTIPQIVSYDHLRVALEKACQQAEIDFKKEYLSGQAMLEVYTCYSVVPMAFLLKTKLVASVADIPAFLKKYPITVTGGLNLARAPWNNTTLQALTLIVSKMNEMKKPSLAGIHSLSSIGYQQAFMILKK